MRSVLLLVVASLWVVLVGARGEANVVLDAAEAGGQFTLGDANCDQRVNSIDAALVLQFDAALISAFACTDQADINQDGRIDSRDAAAILQIDAGLLCIPDPLGMPIVC